MKELNYYSIINNIISLKSDELSSWECEFLNDIIQEDKFITPAMASKIIEINRKYLVRR